ncbi:hypothetical protein ABN028_30405, partial [Actinopolymorpha sp. B17G11]
NQVERWFAFLTDQLLRRGVHKSVQALEKDVREWIKNWNENPKTVRLEEDRRGDPRLPRPIYRTNFRRRTLVDRRPTHCGAGHDALLPRIDEQDVVPAIRRRPYLAQLYGRGSEIM